MATQFAEVYKRFLNKITDDMYIELTPEDTLKDLQNLLIEAIPGFEFPRKNLNDYTISTNYITPEELSLLEDEGFVINVEEGLVDNSFFIEELDAEEIEILTLIMKIGWLQRQITSIENTRMKYSGSDFKFTSQANHLSKMLNLLTELQKQSHHAQRLYKRRKKDNNGLYQSNWSNLLSRSALD